MNRLGQSKISSLVVFILFLCLQITAHAIPFKGHDFLISGPSPHIVETAIQIRKAGGNVADILVASAFTLSVTSPYYASLGGGGFALIKMNNETVRALDFRETAPFKTHKNYYQNKSSEDGITAVGIPGHVAGLWEIHKTYGKLPWKKLIQPALILARKGFRVSGEWVNHTVHNKSRFNTSGLKYFFKAKNTPYLPGELFRQPQLAKALLLIQQKGAKSFYEGIIAKDLVSTSQKLKGDLELSDFKRYKVRWLQPIETEFSDHRVYMMPPPSSAAAVMKVALHLIEDLKVKEHGLFSVSEFHLLGSILARAFRGRTLLADPDFHKNPLEKLFSKKYIQKQADSIDIKKAKAMKPLEEKDLHESTETTHISVMDAKGNAISFTVTLNGSFGSAVVSDKYGIALNNEMDDFTTHPGKANQFGLIQGLANTVEPQKRPLSSMSPTLVTESKSHRVVMSLGSPGGPRIISAVTQVLYRVFSQQLDIDQAIQAPRVHHQTLPDTLYIDPLKTNPEVRHALEKMGHHVVESPVAKVYGITLNSEGILEGAFDSRGEGAVGGY